MNIRNIGLSLAIAAMLVLPLASKAVGETTLVQSVSVFNDTKNRDAALQPADKEDFLTITLTIKNNNTTAANGYIPSINTNSLLTFTDMVDRGGATFAGSVLSYPAINVLANSTVTKSFKVRVKYFLPANDMSGIVLVFGNTLNISINRPSIRMEDITPKDSGSSQVKGAFVAPKTGADINALYFGFLFPAVYGIIVNRKKILGLVK